MHLLRSIARPQLTTLAPPDLAHPGLDAGFDRSANGVQMLLIDLEQGIEVGPFALRDGLAFGPVSAAGSDPQYLGMLALQRLQLAHHFTPADGFNLDPIAF